MDNSSIYFGLSLTAADDYFNPLFWEHGTHNSSFIALHSILKTNCPFDQS